MRAIAFAADSHGCGHHRLIWVAGLLRAAGHDIEMVTPESRKLTINIDHRSQVIDVGIGRDIDVVILQRVTHPHLLNVIPFLRKRGVAVVVDIDDDLSCIHPDNPAFIAMHPKSVGVKMDNGQPNLHSWHNLVEACKQATLVTASTPALIERYAKHGRGRVLPNYLAPHYYGHERTDSDIIGWPASLHSHPDDPGAVGAGLARVVAAGARFRVVGNPAGVGRAFAMPDWVSPDPPKLIDLLDWPAAVAELGIGIAPLADTRFNSAKSWLKIAELSVTGVPWVASPRAEYRRLHALGAGVLADRPKDWRRELLSLVNGPARRQELSEAGRAVADTLRLADHAWRFWEAWTDALKIQRRASSPLGVGVRG